MPHIQVVYDQKKSGVDFDKISQLARQLPGIVAPALFPADTKDMDLKIKVDVFTPILAINQIPVAIRISVGYNKYRNEKGIEKIITEIESSLKETRKKLFASLGEKDFFVKVSFSESEFRCIN